MSNRPFGGGWQTPFAYIAKNIYNLRIHGCKKDIIQKMMKTNARASLKTKKLGISTIFSYLCSAKEANMALRYHNLEIHQINPIHDFHKWGRSCQH